MLRQTAVDERAEAMRQLHSWAGVPSEARADHRRLSRDELPLLASGEQLDVGAHGMTHTPLTYLELESQRQEISQCARLLEAVLGRRPMGFAYPHGDHDQSTRQTVVDSGYAFACTTQPGLVRRSTPRFQLPRCTVLDWSGDEFRRRLKRWQADLLRSLRSDDAERE
jgi:peptidoglycan/xylan/chitin deacetylase (PgdA/CDA1 family)